VVEGLHSTDRRQTALLLFSPVVVFEPHAKVMRRHRAAKRHKRKWTDGAGS